MSERKIGYEIEYCGLSPAESAVAVSQFLNGEVSKEHDSLYHVETKQYGRFQIETDARWIKELARLSAENQSQGSTDFEGSLKKALSLVSENVVPTELISPPLEFSQRRVISDLIRVIRDKGGQGTSDSIGYAFAVQLNPEAKSLEADYLHRLIESFILLEPWLRSQTARDWTRKLTSFAGNYPDKYKEKVLSAKRIPSLENLIQDYLELNATRNRGLDMLPLFAHLRKDQISEALPDEKINARPTFHYRLPDCQLNSKSWDIELEVQRWLLIEDLAEAEELRGLMKNHYLELSDNTEFLKSRWLHELQNYVERIRML